MPDCWTDLNIIFLSAETLGVHVNPASFDDSGDDNVVPVLSVIDDI